MISYNFEKYINLIILFCISIIPFIFLPLGRYRDFFYEPKANVLTVLSILILILVFANRKRLDKFIQVDKINISLFSYFILVSISLVFAKDLELAVQGRPYRIDGYSTMLIYLLLFIAARNSTASISSISKAILITASVLSIYGIFQYFGVDPFPRDFIRENWNRSFATFGNPNFMGAYLVLAIPFALHLYIANQKNIGAAVFGLLFFCLLSTQTRGSWIGYIFSFLSYSIFLFLCQKRPKIIIKRYLIIILVTLLLIMCFNTISDGYFERRFFSIAEEASELISNGENAEKGGASRIYIWKKIIELIKEKPFFGYGIENIMDPFVENFGNEMEENLGRVLYVDKAHNEYLHIAVTTGIPSLVVYLIFIFFSFKKVIIRSIRSPYYWPIISAITGYLIQAFFNISVVSVAYIFWILLGLSSKYNERCN